MLWLNIYLKQICKRKRFHVPKTSFLFIWKPLPLNAGQKFNIAYFSPPKAFYCDPPKLKNFRESPIPRFNYHPLMLWNWGVGNKNFLLFFLQTILLYLKKLSNTVNHSNKLMLTYFFCAVYINLYFKTKHSNETFHLGFYSLPNVFYHRKHISSKSDISVLTKYKNHSPLPHILLSTLPFYSILLIFPEGHFVITPPF